MVLYLKLHAFSTPTMGVIKNKTGAYVHTLMLPIDASMHSYR